MNIRFTLNDQHVNIRRLEALQRTLEIDSPKQIVDAVCDIAVAKLTEFTPSGKTGQIKMGWSKKVTKSGNQFVGVVSNKAESDSTGRMLLRVLENGARYRVSRIFPAAARCLHFFWERRGIEVFTDSVHAKDRLGHQMIAKTKRFLEGSTKRIAEEILARNVSGAKR